MGPFFEEHSEQTEQVGLSEYFLVKNPFPSEIDLTEGEGEDQDFFSVFSEQVYQVEIRQILDSILKAGEKERKKIWLLKNEKIIAEHNIGVVTGLFRALTISTSPRIYSAYVPFPIIVNDPLGGILKWFVDRLTPERFRACVLVFVYRELEKLQDSGMAAQKLPSIDVNNLLEKINETKGDALDELLFIQKPEELKEQEGAVPGAKADDQLEKDKEMVVEVGTNDEDKQELSPEEIEAKKREWEEKKRIRDEFVVFMGDQIAASGLTSQIKAALAVVITEGFEKGRSYIGIGEYRETFKGLLSLVSLYYKNAVAILDRLDDWDMLEETQQATILGGLTELNWLFGKFGILIISTYKRTVELIGEDFASSFEKISLDLWPTTLNLNSPIPADKTADLVTYFIRSDRFRKEKLDELKEKNLPDSYPFTHEGIDALAEQVNGDIGRFLIGAGKLVEAGQSEGYAVIDVDFVKKHSFEKD